MAGMEEGKECFCCMNQGKRQIEESLIYCLHPLPKITNSLLIVDAIILETILPERPFLPKTIEAII